MSKMKLIVIIFKDEEYMGEVIRLLLPEAEVEEKANNIINKTTKEDIYYEEL